MSNTELTTITDNQYQTSLQLITKAEIDTQIATAKAFPRDVSAFIRKSVTMATMTEDIAASCTYALPRSGKTIEGKSVRLAEIIAANYGNIRASFRIIDNDGKKITAQGVCHDVENNVAVSVDVSRRITDRNGKTYSDDMQIVTGNAAGAIAMRNAIYKVVPTAFVDAIWEQAKEVAKGTKATLAARRDKAIAYFNSIGITNEQIFKALEVTGLEAIDLDKLQLLSGFKTAIKNGEATLNEIFNPEPETPVKKPEANPFAETLSNLETVEDVQLFYNTNPDCPEDLVDKRIAEIEANEAGK